MARRERDVGVVAALLPPPQTSADAHAHMDTGGGGGGAARRPCAWAHDCTSTRVLDTFLTRCAR